ncbi:toxin-antitoxin system YwqK family antitoxin [Flavobacterium sp.]|jgi:antitoxin component YwqK of YwqJK toxin-antitoxin module|uniref:toxin-antitoxin system YwqK family antitoxin n=1 Tax=Flavobacterium sp. TaxID=239 RepID=UPI0037BE7785
MKKLCITAMLVVSGVIFAQENNAKHEVVNQMVKSTFYHENGQVQQEGFYKDGKVHGEWISYDINGNKVAMGQYQDGMKVGKWFFWNGLDLAEVDYSDSRVAQVKKWSQGAVVQVNKN